MMRDVVSVRLWLLRTEVLEVIVNVPEFSDTVDTFLACHNQILGWHPPRRPSNDRIEGADNLLQILRRKGYGFTNYTSFATRGVLTT